MTCTHETPDIATAALVDGLCPLCLREENERLRFALGAVKEDIKALERQVETLEAQLDPLRMGTLRHFGEVPL